MHIRFGENFDWLSVSARLPHMPRGWIILVCVLSAWAIFAGLALIIYHLIT
jgi:hypothetical protein